MFDQISVLLPYQADQGPRNAAFQWIKKFYLNVMPEAEIIVGETNDILFSKSKAMNLAAMRASRDIFLIADADVIFNPEIVKEAVRCLEKHSWVVPFSSVINLSQKNTEDLLKSDPVWPMGTDLYEYREKRVYDRFAGKLNVISRSNFFAVGGFDDRFQGWGGEDDAFSCAVNTLCGPFRRLDSKIYHLWHPHVGSKRNPNFEFNRQLKKKYRGCSGNRDDMLKLIKGGKRDSL